MLQELRIRPAEALEVGQGTHLFACTYQRRGGYHDVAMRLDARAGTTADRRRQLNPRGARRLELAALANLSIGAVWPGHCPMCTCDALVDILSERDRDTLRVEGEVPRSKRPLVECARSLPPTGRERGQLATQCRRSLIHVLAEDALGSGRRLLPTGNQKRQRPQRSNHRRVGGACAMLSTPCTNGWASPCCCEVAATSCPTTP